MQVETTIEIVVTSELPPGFAELHGNFQTVSQTSHPGLEKQKLDAIIGRLGVDSLPDLVDHSIHNCYDPAWAATYICRLLAPLAKTARAPVIVVVPEHWRGIGPPGRGRTLQKYFMIYPSRRRFL